MDIWLQLIAIDCNGQLEKDPAELVQNIFLGGCWKLINTAMTMRAGLRKEGSQRELKPNVGTLSSG